MLCGTHSLSSEMPPSMEFSSKSMELNNGSRSTTSYKILIFKGSRSGVSKFLTSLRHMGHLTLKFLNKHVARHSVQNVWPQWTRILGIRAPTLYYSPQK